MNDKNAKRLAVTPEHSGKRADVILSDFLPGHTRSQIKRLIDNNSVRVDGKVIKPARKLETGEIITVILPEPETLDLEPEDIPLQILYEDADIIAVNKPAGMTVHPGAGVRNGTLVNALLYICRDLSGIGGKIRPGIVHRLDKDTTGVMVVAKNDSAHASLASQFKDREVKKKYIAVVEGRITQDSGSYDSDIGRHRTQRVKMSSNTDSGRKSLTQWKVLRRLEGATVVRAEPKTGRTHQIRVHFSENGYPIIGDSVYGRKKSLSQKIAEAGKKIGRQALHAEELGIIHPVTGVELLFKAPLPKDMKELIDSLDI